MRGKTRLVGSILFAAGLGGCKAGQVTIVAPEPRQAVTASVTVPRKTDDVWKETVARLSQNFFVINNIDRASGLINVSFSGDPEQFVDCGKVTSYVKNARGERTYDFPGARAHEVYEVMTGGDLVTVDRTIALEGRANLVLQDQGPSSTLVSVNVRYVLSRTIRARDVVGKAMNATESINFGSNDRAAFAGNNDGQATTCQSNGVLERRLLGSVER